MSESGIQRISVRVHGVVQGVFYRASTREYARSLGITGWVRNTPDGAVELEAQGPSEALEQLVAWCHHGPPAAAVSRVDTAFAEHVLADESGFRVRH